MRVDVVTETVIDRPPAEVAAHAADSTNVPAWYDNIRSVEWQTPPLVAVGSRMDLVGALPRAPRRLYMVVKLSPGE